ncbi:MAG: hypothetical protein IJJ13_07950 [Lachnospiraceae bacterium]|nr:hypothetical protein [Lachnospiraceae bacterium]
MIITIMNIAKDIPAGMESVMNDAAAGGRMLDGVLLADDRPISPDIIEYLHKRSEKSWGRH